MSQETAVSWRLVDADAHIDPPHEMWKDYLPANLRELAPYVEEGEECDWVVFEGQRRPIRMISNQAGRAGKDFKMVGKRSEMRASWKPEQRSRFVFWRHCQPNTHCRETFFRPPSLTRYWPTA